MTYDEQGLYIEEAQLESYAENFARTLKVSAQRRPRETAVQLRRTLRRLSSDHDALELKWQGIPSMPGAVRWLLDNHYLARREGQGAASAFLGSEALPYAGEEPVIVRLCGSLVRSGHGALTPERMELFLKGFQKCMILTRSELLLLGAGLRAALVAQLAALSRALREENAAPGAETGMENIFTSLRYLSSASLEQIVERADKVEQTLRQDPADIYRFMDEATRSFYRGRVASLARRRGVSEYRIARLVGELAGHGEGEQAHVGWWLLREPMGYRPVKRRGGLYISLIVVITLFLSILSGFAAESVWAALLLVLPAWDLVKNTLDYILLRTVPPAHIPRMELRDGVPDEGRTLCVISAILTDAGAGEELARKMEEYSLCSRDCGRNLMFALLADLPESAGEQFPAGNEIMTAAREAVHTLSTRYGGGFFLLTRPRRQYDGNWMGWERKRGALLETMRFLRGRPSGIVCAAGDAAELAQVNYLLALDSDTRLEPDSAKKLVGAMLHPLNRPVIDTKQGIVVSGYGMISPRMAVSLQSAVRSDFSRIFAGQGGGDPYDGVCGEVYMDVWDSGGGTGKSIIDIDAYLACMEDRIPEGSVLSHDALEGAFLHGGFMGDTELTDVFPATAVSFYKRMHRWIRGDWQNAPWLFSRGRALPDIERFRIFDNLRRSLTPVSVLSAICVGFFLPRAGLAAALAALLVCAAELVLSAAQTLFAGEEELRTRYHSMVLPGIGGALVRTWMRLILLPAEAFFCLDAVARAVWRMMVSRRRLLQWQTAGQSDALGTSLAGTYAAMWPAALLGALLVVLSPAIIGRAAGVLWLLSPLCAYVLGMPEQPKQTVNASERGYLLGRAQEIWKFFECFMTEENHYLPPDNYQAQPPVGAAHRTSPTNIGLALLAVISARDMGLAEPDAAMELIEKSIASIEKLKKWNGHLYNWYNTHTLEVLKPEYVSTVDSGNLYACLTALRQALRQAKREDLAQRVSRLMEPMNFKPLFDEERKLFYTGLDPSSEKKPESWYDLMASEVRLAAYAAIAKGDVPRKLWQRLSRALVQKNGYRGMVSWTGTMFEYLMPELLLPLYRDGMLYESARFCAYVQRGRTAGSGRPWGISESAFYSLDASMSYRYKAHGCAALALKRGMDEELVVSPYSSFLALCVKPKSAVRNLRVLEKFGMRGTFGMWEALDFTKGRALDGKPAVVKCVMAHHLGMSIAAIANCVEDGVITRYFMADARMSAYAGLLQERVPIGGPVLKRDGRRVPERRSEHAMPEWEHSGEGVSLLRPECCLLSGMAYSMLIAENGACIARCGGLSPYLPADGPFFEQHGISFAAQTAEGEKTLLPRRGSDGRFSWRFTPTRAEIRAEYPDFSALCTAMAARDDTGEKRRVRIERREKELREMSVSMRFTPLLGRLADYYGHPAFNKLGLSAKLSEGCLVIRRVARGSSGEQFLCAACDVPCTFLNVPGMDTGRFSGGRVFDGSERFMTEPLIECRAQLGAQEHCEVCFALCMANTEGAAIESARRLLLAQDEDYGDMPRRAAAVLGMDHEDLAGTFSMLPELFLGSAPKKGGDYRRGELWKFGISGDLPIICAEFDDSALEDEARRLMDSHLILCACGFEADLVFITDDKPGYRRPLNSALEELLWHNGGDVLSGARGGVHIVENFAGAQGVRSCASVTVKLTQAREPVQRQCQELRTLPGRERCLPAEVGEYGWDREGRFEFKTSNSLPPRAWTNLLTNGRLSYLAADSGCGNLWYLNARENPVSPWEGLPLAVDGPETLCVRTQKGMESLFAGHGSTRVAYEPGCAVWEKPIENGTVRLTAFIPPQTDARVFLIECRGISELTLHWRLKLQLAPNRDDARYVQTSERNGMLTASNSRGIGGGSTVFQAVSTPGFAEFTCSERAALRGEYDAAAGACADSVFAASMCVEHRAVLVCGCCGEEALRALADFDRARAALDDTLQWWKNRLSGFALASPDNALDHIMNGWVAYQALACRVMGRGSIYQSGGAYGYRDQLQDTVNLMLLDPAYARAQILRSCARQYREGDVQHWWHEGADEIRGVRTHCSDDLLWLPWAVCEYIESTGDMALLQEKTPYLVSEPLRAQEKDRYEAAAVSEEQDTVLRHCLIALDAILKRGTGEHGLLRFGSGDWNDGFDRVGGESEWLTWFFCHTALRFAALMEQLEPGSGDWYRRKAETLRRSAENAWDGGWYLRGYYENGKKLGSAENAECAIDSIAQSFAAFCPGTDQGRVKTALLNAVEQLYDSRSGVIRLFTPPFSGLGQHPGYIESYGPGFRENGGQYTHGALWLVSALLKTGETELGWQLLRAALPADRNVHIYKGEPYVMPADVYSAPGHEGEAGWTWYTGSAGWLLRVVTEDLLGITIRGGRLFVEPVLPKDWGGYEARVRSHSIRVQRDGITVDGQPYDPAGIAL